jgi:hypothetical protein
MYYIKAIVYTAILIRLFSPASPLPLSVLSMQTSFPAAAELLTNRLPKPIEPIRGIDLG